jgi:hypothetical protein
MSFHMHYKGHLKSHTLFSSTKQFSLITKSASHKSNMDQNQIYVTAFSMTLETKTNINVLKTSEMKHGLTGTTSPCYIHFMHFLQIMYKNGGNVHYFSCDNTNNLSNLGQRSIIM